MLDVWDIHSETIPENADLLTVHYLLEMADGSVVETDPVPVCISVQKGGDVFLQLRTGKNPYRPQHGDRSFVQCQLSRE